MTQLVIRTFKNEELLRASPPSADGDLAYTIDKLIMWWGVNGQWVTVMVPYPGNPVYRQVRNEHGQWMWVLGMEDK